MNASAVQVAFGALVDPLIAQLPKPVRFRRTWLSCCKTWQQDADAITRLSIHRHISEKETARARQRLLKTIAYFYKQNSPTDFVALCNLSKNKFPVQSEGAHCHTLFHICSWKT